MIPFSTPQRGFLHSDLAGGEPKNRFGETIGSDDMFKRLEALPATSAPTSQAVAEPNAASLQKPLPSAPPNVRSTNPWSKENRQRTLLDIGAAFLSSKDFFSGAGQAASAIGNRMDELKAEQRPRHEYGGPGGQFEITTSPDGSRQIRKVPEFSDAINEERAAELAGKLKVPDPKDIIELRARALRAIRELPEDQRAAAYTDLMTNPSRYGGLDVRGMPQAYDPNYASVMGGMGQSVYQAENADFRERKFVTSTQQADRRLDQGDKRISAAGRKASRAASAPKPPAGFILD